MITKIKNLADKYGMSMVTAVYLFDKYDGDEESIRREWLSMSYNVETKFSL